MSDAAMKVDPEFYNRRLLETDASVEQSRRAFLDGGRGAVGEGMGRGAALDGPGGVRAGGYAALDLPDYVVRQHSLLGFYLSLSPRDEGVQCETKIKSICPHVYPTCVPSTV